MILACTRFLTNQPAKVTKATKPHAERIDGKTYDGTDVGLCVEGAGLGDGVGFSELFKIVLKIKYVVPEPSPIKASRVVENATLNALCSTLSSSWFGDTREVGMSTENTARTGKNVGSAVGTTR